MTNAFRQSLSEFAFTLFCKTATNGLRYLRVGGRGFCLRAEKTRSQKNARKCRRIPPVRCTLCWAVFRLPKTRAKNRHKSEQLTAIYFNLSFHLSSGLCLPRMDNVDTFRLRDNQCLLRVDNLLFCPPLLLYKHCAVLKNL